jgi:hypothetical protein
LAKFNSKVSLPLAMKVLKDRIFAPRILLFLGGSHRFKPSLSKNLFVPSTVGANVGRRVPNRDERWRLLGEG